MSKEERDQLYRLNGKLLSLTSQLQESMQIGNEFSDAAIAKKLYEFDFETYKNKIAVAKGM